MRRIFRTERRAFRTTLIAAGLVVACLSASASAGEGSGSNGHGDGGNTAELRSYGRYANIFASRALRKCEWAGPFDGGDSAAYAYAFAFYAAEFGQQAGYVVQWRDDDLFNFARDDAYDVYFGLRYQQGLYDYYASLHAQIAFQETGTNDWRDAAKFAQLAALYARYDISY